MSSQHAVLIEIPVARPQLEKEDASSNPPAEPPRTEAEKPESKDEQAMVVSPDKKEIPLIEEDIVDDFPFLSAASPAIFEAEEKRRRMEDRKMALERAQKKPPVSKPIFVEDLGAAEKKALSNAGVMNSMGTVDESEPVVIVLKDEEDDSQTFSFVVNPNSKVGPFFV